MKTKTFLTFILLTFTFSFSTLFAQKIKLGLPVGHTDWVKFATYSPDGKNIITVSDDKTAKIWDAETGKLLHSLEGHTEFIKSSTYSPDGKNIVTASWDKTTKIWDAETGELLYSLEEHTKNVNSAAYSPDGKTIVTASLDKTAKIWDSQTGELLHSLEGHTGGVYFAGYSPDGKNIVTASSDKTAKIWDSKTGELLHSLIEPDYIISAEYSPDGKTIITTSRDKTAKIWDSETGKLLNSLEGHTENVVSAAYSPDGKTIVTASSDKTAKIWDAETGKLLHSLEGHTRGVKSATYSPDGKTIITVYDFGKAKIWDAETGKLLHSWEGYYPYGVYSAAYGPDGRTIVTASDDKTAKIWDTQTGELLYSLKGHTNGISSTIYSLDGKNIVTTSDNTVKIWNNQTGELLHSLKEYISWVNSATYSPDGKNIVTAAGWKAKIWDSETGKLLHSLKGHTGDVESATYSPDGKTIVTASNDKTAKIWDAETGKLLHSLEGHTNWVKYATYSPNGKTILTASSNTPKIWDAETGKLLHSLEGHIFYVRLATYSPDGKKIVTASYDKTARIWDAETGELLHSLEGHTNYVYSAAYSPDGKTIVTASGDKTAKIWDVETGKLLHSSEGHTDDVIFAVYSPDGKTIVTASQDNTAKIWDVETGKLLYSLEGHTNNVTSAIYSHAGETILTASDDGSIIIWDAQTGKKLLQQFIIDGKETVTITENGLFDATSGAMEKMYFVQGLDIIEFSQLKDRYWEPDLWKKVMAGEELRKVTGFGNTLPLFPEVKNLVIKNETLECDLFDQGGGIGKYFIFINGKEAFVGNNSKEVYKEKILKVKFDFKDHKYLIPGIKNKITVKAYNAENYIISRGAVVEYSKKEESKEVVKPNIFIVSCGVSNYTGDAIDLRYASKDAEDIINSLKLGGEKLFGKDKTYTYLLNTDHEKDKYPTKENIINTFDEISKKAKSTDIIVLYLSGHGINHGGQDGDFYYLTQDAYTASGDAYNDPAIRSSSTLSSNELVELFKKVPANKQVLIIDACASGQVVEDLLAERDISSSTIRALDRMKDRTGMYIITGSAADAVSYEASKYGQGLLTYSLLEGMKGASLREGQFIDVDILFQRAKDRVPDLAKGIGGIQEPQFFYPYGSSSFDIGLLNDSEKEKIPLAKEKPVFVMSTFMESESFDDILGLETLVDEKLRTVSAKGSEANLIFYETKNFPDAYRLRGLYSISGNEITLNLNIFYGKEKQQSVKIKGKKNNIDSFIKNIIEIVSLKIKL